MFDIPYVIVFAIATADAVFIYSTESISPIAVVGGIHYSLLTDLAWFNSKILAVSSSDGYCSFLYLENEQVGVELNKECKIIYYLFKKKKI